MVARSAVVVGGAISKRSRGANPIKGQGYDPATTTDDGLLALPCVRSISTTTTRNGHFSANVG